MSSIIKKVTAGAGGAFIFFVLYGQNMPWWLSAILAISGYFGICVLFPPETRKVRVELPKNVSQREFGRFMGQCGTNLAEIRDLAADIKNLEFRSIVYRLCARCDELLASFEKDPAGIKIAAAFPDRLGRLRVMLESYNELSELSVHSKQTLKALAATESAVSKALDKFEQIHHRLLENEALDLSVNAKTFDNLLDFD